MTKPDDKSLDLSGIGKAMQAIPESSWEKLVVTACDTFEKVVAPITETAGGFGRLVSAKFDKLVDVEKVLAAQAVAAASKKARRATVETRTPRPNILIQVIENAASEADPGIRELWSNLLAQEMTGHGIHPEIGRILSRISSEDAQVLSTIADRWPTSLSQAFSEALRRALAISPLRIVVSASVDPRTFNHEHLDRLGLIIRRDGFWELTTIGKEFIKAVSDPELTAAATEDK